MTRTGPRPAVDRNEANRLVLKNENGEEMMSEIVVLTGSRLGLGENEINYEEILGELERRDRFPFAC